MVLYEESCPHCGNIRKRLTSRQIEVVKAIVSYPAFSCDDLADKLSISPNTVKSHLREIYKELGVSNKLQCVVTCLGLGIIQTDDFPMPLLH